ncbi:DUF736 domain-containing protein [Asticcacaulis sp.]|uniref:DUF736 domain-containing protein n=1 Tax=Asticcacaulis sp. TaxID=1872648 RepID=UPI002C2569D0|nr:DUF736 domain-containing protein [Asticcacaulis sp.]HTM81574.1 DUF736 domain-containing protein [Asticcacaulis sp.]
MSIIGTFVKAGDTYAGSVKALTLNVKAKLVATEGGSEQSPDFRVYAGTVEIGAGWKKISDSQREYVSLKLDDPSLPHPIFASLFPADEPDTYNLIWSRPKAS